MITNTGKSIVTKYLLGQTPAYASYIAVGCGPKPYTSISYNVAGKVVASNVATLYLVSSTSPSSAHDILVNDYVSIAGVGYGLDGTFKVTAIATTGITAIGAYTVSSISFATIGIPDFTDYTAGSFGDETPWNSYATKNYSTKTSLDFEMFRVPITSRGYVTETDSSGNAISKIVLTAQLPTEERYEITEFGLYPSNSNPSAGNYDSKTIFGFTQSEAWTNSAGSTVTVQISALDQGTTAGTINNSTLPTIFQTNSDNSIFNNETRLNRQERPRFYNNTYMVRGDTATLSLPAGSTSAYDMTVLASTNYLKLPSFSSSFANNSTSDELRIAFSVINTVFTDPDPTTVKILVKFKTSTSDYASFWISQGIGSSLVNGVQNRYFAISKKLQDIYKTPTFSWNAVTSVEVYSSVELSGTPSSAYYVSLDAMRIENLASSNPLYGLVGYTPIINTVNNKARPVIKNSNTSNFVEFRFIADVV